MWCLRGEAYSEQIQAVRDRNISLHHQESLILGFLMVVLMCRTLLGGAVLNK
ncbi:hypothetical protein HMPREF9104_01046 [Lentilactobacillus kisonensis F0435]|uniref:Uncharacterized protein n=1 Tax=Lentilactobacillus kisonensis F0435 TaxID=797516 RepID=H1LEM0_9LACO|nr:hypothetical protein HMPREF9104_01046 [Lentilactobacillus kisonensis F0435]